MPSLEETARSLNLHHRQRLKSRSELSQYHRSQWDLMVRRTKFESPADIVSGLRKLLEAIGEVVTAVNSVDTHLENLGVQDAPVREPEEISHPVIHKVLQELGETTRWGQVREQLFNLYGRYSFLHDCHLIGIMYGRAGERMPQFDSLRERLRDLQRVENKVRETSPTLGEEIHAHTDELHEHGVEMADEDVAIAQFLADYLDILPRQIEDERELFIDRLRAEHAKARRDPQRYTEPSSNPQWFKAALGDTFREFLQRIDGIEKLTRCLEMPDGDPGRGPILDSLIENPQVQGLLMTMGASPDGLTNILETLQRVHMKWQFQAFSMGLIRSAFREYGNVPELQSLLENLEMRFDIDLRCGPSKEICEIATDEQERSLKVMYQAVSRHTMTSFNDFAGVVGSAAEARKNLAAVNRLLIKVLQRDFDKIDSSRPRHYCRWDGGNQRMVRDLWEGNVSPGP
jgi:hypothetical protein